MAKKLTGRIYTAGAKATYYLRYKVQGKDNRVRLLDPAGAPIQGTGLDGEPLSRAAANEARKAAEAAAARHLAHLRETDKAERLRIVLNDLRDAETAAAEAEADTLNARATIEAGFDIFMACSKRPASCRRYKTAEAIPTNTTAACYRAYYGRFAAWLKKRHPKARLLSEVTPTLANEFTDDLSATTASGTFNKYLQFLKRFYAVLIAAGKVTCSNPFEDIEPVDGETHSKRPLSREQIAKLLDTSTGELQALVATGYFTGLRFGDSCCLRWDEVDLGRGVIERQPSKTKSTAKDKDKARVKIGIPPALAALLAALPRTGDYVLPGMAAKYLAGRKAIVNNELMKHLARCGIATRAEGTGAAYHYEGKKKVYAEGRPRAVVQYGFHSLRYSYISHNAELGTPAAVIQANAGHSNPAMTEHYTRISDAAAVKYAAALDLPAATPAARDMVIDLEPADPDTASDTPTGARAQLRRIIDAMTEDQLHDLLASMKGRA